ncbi:hypothetical protein O6H91_22G069900 [Diphasiastrum complanatum]|uniref:Uncharacterized protein n=1 Tax=Diphasiastrum complanatum TaxID=34168 RepID=A0ACC2AGS4_DIPCM|nr:hypothetical protein O6H91_22G069900 [Diphasiastrum complanatum]
MWHIVTDVQSIDGQMCNQSIKIHKQLHDRFLVCYMSVSKVLICFGINRHFLNSLSLAAREKTFNANSLTARSVKVFNTNLVTGEQYIYFVIILSLIQQYVDCNCC